MVFERALRRIDRIQQRVPPLAFGIAVAKKFGEDQGGNLAALITYYGFLSIFPLMLALTTILAFVLHGHPGLQHDIVNSALADFPIIGDQIKRNVGSLHGSGIALAIGLAGALYGGLGIASAAQNAMDTVWEVPREARPSFLSHMLRNVELIATLGLGIVVAMTLSAIGGGGSGLGGGVRWAAIVLGFALNAVLFSIAFRVLTARDLSWPDVVPGAVVAAAAWGVFQVVGGAFVEHRLRGMSQTYGLFAIVLGLLAWIFLQAQVIVYAAEINVVRARRLWPRSISRSELTGADRLGYTADAKTENRHRDERIHVDFPSTRGGQ